MNAKGDELGLVDTNFENPHGLDARGHVSSARDATILVRYALGVRSSATRSTGRPSARRQDFPTTDDLLVSWPALVGGKTGHTRGGLVASCRCKCRWRNGVRSRARKRYRSSQRGASRPSYIRARAVPAHRRDRQGTRLCRAETGYGKGPAEPVAPRAIVRTLRVGTPLVDVARADVGAPGAEGPASGPGRRLRRKPARRAPPSWQPGPSPSPASWGRRGGMRRRQPRTYGASSRDRHRHRQRCARPHSNRAHLPNRLPPPLERGPHARGW